MLYHFCLEFEDKFKSFVKFGLNTLYNKLKIWLYAKNMQMRWLFPYDYDFQKWEVQYYYRPEFGGHIQKFYFPVNFKLPGLNHRKHMHGDSGGYDHFYLIGPYF